MHFKNDIANLCRKHGLRLTGPRRVILDVLSEADDHPDAVELHRRVTAIDPGISIATIYRTLNLLQEKGVLEKHLQRRTRAIRECGTGASRPSDQCGDG